MIAPKGTPAAVVKYLHDSVKATVEDPRFVETMKERAAWRPPTGPATVMRTDLWREYKLHTKILTRIGMIKKP